MSLDKLLNKTGYSFRLEGPLNLLSIYEHISV